MRICIVGAGAIGGFLGAKLALAGEDVTLIARGPHLAAIQRDGLRLLMADGGEAVASGTHARIGIGRSVSNTGNTYSLKVFDQPKNKPNGTPRNRSALR